MKYVEMMRRVVREDVWSAILAMVLGPIADVILYVVAKCVWTHVVMESVFPAMKGIL